MSEELVQVRRHLADIPELLEEASHYLIPGSAPIDPTATRGTTIFRIPITPEIFDLLDERDKALDDIMLNRSGGERRLGVLPTLGLWVSLAWAELDDTGRTPRECCPAREHTVAGEVRWLSEYAGDIIELHPEFHRDVEQLWEELRRACRIRKDYAPKCPRCGFKIEGIFGSEEDEYPAWYRCTGCPKTWVKEAELRRLGATQPPMTLRQIASMLKLSCRDVYGWYSKNRYMPVGTDGRGRKLFEVEHVKSVALADGRRIAA